MAEYNPSKIVKDGNTYNFRDDTKIPLAGSNQISGDLIPATNGTVNLGSPSYQWNNAYIKSLTINGVACGDILTHNASEFVKVTGNQIIGGAKTFSSDIRISKASPFCNVFSSGYIKGQAPTSNIYSGVRFYDDINSGSLNNITGGFEVEYNRDGYNKSYIASRNYAGENHKLLTVGLRVPNDDIRSIDFLPSVNGIVNLGTSTNKWKSFNGINPGALSLPDNSKSVVIDTTNWDVVGGTNVYTPPANGWLHIRVTDATELAVRWTDWRFGDRRVSATATDLGVTIPVVAGVTIDVITVASSFNSKCQFFPCQGNA